MPRPTHNPANVERQVLRRIQTTPSDPQSGLPAPAVAPLAQLRLLPPLPPLLPRPRPLRRRAFLRVRRRGIGVCHFISPDPGEMDDGMAQPDLAESLWDSLVVANLVTLRSTDRWLENKGADIFSS